MLASVAPTFSLSAHSVYKSSRSSKARDNDKKNLNQNHNNYHESPQFQESTMSTYAEVEALMRQTP